MMTRKDYRVLADTIRAERIEWLQTGGVGVKALDSLAKSIASTFYANSGFDGNGNRKFDRDRFLVACGVPR
jgi:hypothetical protein